MRYLQGRRGFSFSFSLLLTLPHRGICDGSISVPLVYFYLSLICSSISFFSIACPRDKADNTKPRNMSADTLRQMSDNTHFSQDYEGIRSSVSSQNHLPCLLRPKLFWGVRMQSLYSLVNRYQTRRERKGMEKIQERWKRLKDLVGEKGKSGSVATIFLWKMYTSLLICHFPCQGEYVSWKIVLSQIYALYRCFMWTCEHSGAMSNSLES